MWYQEQHEQKSIPNNSRIRIGPNEWLFQKIHVFLFLYRPKQMYLSCPKLYVILSQVLIILIGVFICKVFYFWNWFVIAMSKASSLLLGTECNLWVSYHIKSGFKDVTSISVCTHNYTKSCDQQFKSIH